MSTLNLELPQMGTLSSFGPAIKKPVAQETITPSPDDNYESFFKKVLEDQDGMYLGAAFKTPSRTPQLQSSNYALKTPDTANSMQQETAKAATTPETKLPMQTITGEVGKGLSSLAQANDNLSRNEYEDDLTYWNNQGKHWFDPEQASKPNLEEHLNQMPSSTDALSKDAFGGNFMNPAGWQFKNSEAATYVLNPLKAFDKIGGEGFAKYISSSGVKRGVSAGSVGGPVGYIGGAIAGVIEGMFTWNAAKDEDAKNKENARIEYEKKLKEWTIAKNRRLVAQNVVKYDDMQNKKAVSKAQEKADNAEKARTRSEKRAALINALSNAGKMRSSYSAERKKRWEK